MRSFNRDVESQFYFYSYCDKFSKRMNDEISDIFVDSKKIDINIISKDKDIKIKSKHKLFSKLLKNYL